MFGIASLKDDIMAMKCDAVFKCGKTIYAPLLLFSRLLGGGGRYPYTCSVE